MGNQFPSMMHKLVYHAWADIFFISLKIYHVLQLFILPSAGNAPGKKWNAIIHNMTGNEV